MNVINYLILPAALGLVAYTFSSRSEYRDIHKKGFRGVLHGRCLRPTASAPYMGRLSAQCGILNISQPYRPPRPVTGIAVTSVYAIILILTHSDSEGVWVC
jgi:hypothetical protein